MHGLDGPRAVKDFQRRAAVGGGVKAVFLHVGLSSLAIWV
jgi:hypothetical protein